MPIRDDHWLYPYMRDGDGMVGEWDTNTITICHSWDDHVKRYSA